MVIEEQGQPWLATALRCTVFAIVPPEKGDFLSLEELTGNIPDEVKANPKVGSSEEFLSSGADVVSLKQEPGRIDLVRQAKIPDEQKDLVGIPVLGALKDQCEDFRILASKIFDRLQVNNVGMRRIAFGLEAVIPVEDHRAGYQLLDKFLPFVEVDPDSSDFVFGVNRRRSSKVLHDLQVNRLSRWSLRRLLAKLHNEIDIDFYGVHLMLDINSVPDEKKDLTGIQSKKLFGEFIDLAYQILEKGDCK